MPIYVQGMPDFRTTIKDELLEARLAGAEHGRRSIVERWPIDTGESARGFEVEVQGDVVEVTNDVRWVPYVHDGLVDDLAVDVLPEVEAVTQERIRSFQIAR